MPDPPETPRSPGRPGVDQLPAPVDLAGLVRSAWGLYRRNAWGWIATTFIAYAVLHTAQTIALRIADDRLSEVGQQVTQFVFGIVLVSLLGSVLVIVLIPAMAAATVGQGRPLSWVAGRTRARTRHPMLALPYALLVGTAMILPPFGFLLLVVGTEILLAAVAGPPIAVHALVHEGVAPRHLGKRTKSLMKGQWLRVGMNMLTLALALGIVQFLFLQGAVLLATPLGISEGLEGTIYLAIAQTVFAALAFPLIFLAWWVSYLDVRSHNDGYGRAELEGDVAESAQGTERQPGLTGP